MRTAVSSTSIAAVAASQALWYFASTSDVVSAVETSYKGRSDYVDANIDAAGAEECTFVKSPRLRGYEADAGILGCADPSYMCVEDELSSLGGRCARIAISHRDLQTLNTDVCASKCTGFKACDGLSPSFIANNIAEGSCCGYKACLGVTGASSIGPGSCLGNKACYYTNNAIIGTNSCTGDRVKGGYNLYGFSCAYLQGTVGDSSCYEYAACYQYYKDNKVFNIGNDSCRGQASCTYTGGASIGDRSCTGYYACYTSYGNVGSDSCNNQLACEFNTGNIGDGVCNIDGECRNNSTPIPPVPSPTQPPTSSAPITNPPTDAPTSSPTVFNSPTKKPVPTASPTELPTALPTTSPTFLPTKTPSSSPSASPTSSFLPTIKSPPTRKPSMNKSGKVDTKSGKKAAKGSKVTQFAITWFDETGENEPTEPFFESVASVTVASKPTTKLYVTKKPVGKPNRTEKPTASSFTVANNAVEKSSKPTSKRYITKNPTGKQSFTWKYAEDNDASNDLLITAVAPQKVELTPNNFVVDVPEEVDTVDNDWFVITDNDEPVRTVAAPQKQELAPNAFVVDVSEEVETVGNDWFVIVDNDGPVRV